MEDFNLKEKRKSAREIGLKTLEQSGFARNSDWCYLFDFLYHAQGIVIPRAVRNDIYKSGLNLRTIMRERQYIQNTMGIYPPTISAVIANRTKLQQDYTNEYKN